MADICQRRIGFIAVYESTRDGVQQEAAPLRFTVLSRSIREENDEYQCHGYIRYHQVCFRGMGEQATVEAEN